MQVTNILKGDPTIVNRYLADQLAENERRAFEALLVSDPDLLRELEATARLKAGLQKLRDTDQLDALVAEQRSRTPCFSPLQRQSPFSFWDSACFAGTLTPGTHLAASISKLVDQSGNPLPIASTHAVFRKRADAYDTEITLPASRQAIELSVLPDLRAPQTSYRAALSLIRDDGAADAAASIEPLQAAGDGSVTMFVDSSRCAWKVSTRHRK